MKCQRHPAAAAHAGHCAACLLEEALLARQDTAVASELTIEMPLGETAAGSVHLVRAAPRAPLLRLKTWHAAAPARFLPAFATLRDGLRTWGTPEVAAPLAATVNERGLPSVLSTFRSGMPIATLVANGRMDRARAAAHLDHLERVIRSGHTRGLVHGSIRAGNVKALADGSPAYLLDFGLAALLGRADAAPGPAADLAGLTE